GGGVGAPGVGVVGDRRAAAAAVEGAVGGRGLRGRLFREGRGRPPRRERGVLGRVAPHLVLELQPELIHVEGDGAGDVVDADDGGGVQELVAMASGAHGVDRIETLLDADSSVATSSVSQTTTPHRRAADVPRPVVVRTDRYPDGNRMGAHEHRKAQLVYSPDGVLRVATDVGTFVVPPEWAVWVPSWMRHDVQSSTPLTLRSVYVEP